MKKTLIFTMLLVTVILFTGCGTGKNTTNQNGTSSTQVQDTQQTTANSNTSGASAEHVTNETSGEYSANTGEENTISEAKAKEIALSQVPGATENDIVKCKKDYDDGRLEYDVEIHYNNMEYDFEIDAYTGSIYDTETEPI